MNERLYRSQTDKMIAGVCSGLGHHLNIDPTLVRLFFVLLTLAQGVGLFLYLVLWIVLPCAEQDETGSPDAFRARADEVARQARALGQDLKGAMGKPQQTGLFAGAALIFLGFVFLMDNLHIWWLRWLDFDIMWPVLLIIAGAMLIYRRANPQRAQSTAGASAATGAESAAGEGRFTEEPH